MLTKSNFFIRHRKLIIILGIVTALAVLGVISVINTNKKPTMAMTKESNNAIVTKGNITVSISGSGSIKSSSTKNISSEVSATVNKVYINVGDRVSKGDVLFELDSSNLETQIRNKEKTVTTLSKSIKSYKEDISNLKVYATNDGYISNLRYSVGDSVNKNSVLFSTTDMSTYRVIIDFYYNVNNPINVGDSAKLMLTDSFVYMDGVVSKVTDLKKTSEYGGQLQTIEIEIPNPGYTLENVAVTNISVTTQRGLTASSAGVGKITTNDAKEVKSKASGTIKELYISNGSKVNAGDLVIVLENSDLYDNLSDAQTSLKDANEQLANVKDDYSFYTITSPIDGIVTSINVSEDDYVRSESTLAKIVNNYEIEFEIDVDELDILNLKVGQEANVTIDAIESTKKEPMKGVVSKIAIEGTTMNSVTSYPVTISLKGNDDIKMGMNCSAEIIVNSVRDVLVLPVEAISSRKGKYYVTVEGGTQKEVEVGLYNEDLIEIVSGLTEGEIVTLPVTVKSDNNKNPKNEMSGGSGFGSFPMGGNMGGMPGGMPSGGSGSRSGNFSGGMPNKK